MNNEERDNRIIEIHAAVGRIEEIVSRHDQTLYGGNRQGLCERIQIMETTMGLRSRLGGAVYTMVVAITGGSVGALAGALAAKFFLKL